MLARPLLMRILADEALTRDLGDPEARVLVEWLVERAERLGEEVTNGEVEKAVSALCRRGRAIARFVSLWGSASGRRGALQLAACERFAWPLPTGPVDSCELMQRIVAWEDRGGTFRPAA